MLPLVLRLQGEAIIDDGMLLYRFPELQKRARAEAAAPRSRLGGMVARGRERVNSLVFGESLAGVKEVAPESGFLTAVGALQIYMSFCVPRFASAECCAEGARRHNAAVLFCTQVRTTLTRVHHTSRTCEFSCA